MFVCNGGARAPTIGCASCRGASCERDAFVGACRWVHISWLWRPNLRDEADNHLIELAVAGDATHIVTNNLKDFRGSELQFDTIRVLSPADFLNEEHHAWPP